MSGLQNQGLLKRAGIGAILILAALRFFLVPLHNWTEREKQLLTEQQACYTQKIQLLEKVREKAGTPLKKEELLAFLYGEEEDATAIQLDMVAWLGTLARKQGGTLSQFDFYEKVTGETLGEIPIGVTFEGSPLGLMKILKGMEETEKVLGFQEMELRKNAKGMTLSLILSAYCLEGAREGLEGQEKK